MILQQLFCHLLLLALKFALNDASIWNRLLIDVRCTNETVLVQYNRSVQIGGDLHKVDIGCCNQTVQQSASVSAKFRDCNLVKNFVTDTVFRRDIPLNLYANGNVIQSINVTCIESTQKLPVSVALKMYKTDSAQTKYFHSGQPIDVVFGTELRFVPNVTIVTLSEQHKIGHDIYGYPKKCWISEHRKSSDDQNRLLVLLDEGCPSDSLSTVIQDISAVGANQFSFVLSGKTLPLKNREEEAEAEDHFKQFQVHCDIIPCSLSRFVAIVDLPRCPSASFCSGQPSRHLPVHLAQSASVHSVFRSIVPLQRALSKVSAVDLNNDCAKVCADLNARRPDKTDTLLLDSGSRLHQQERSGWTPVRVTVLNVVSFFSGIAFTSIIWLLRSHSVLVVLHRRKLPFVSEILKDEECSEL